MGQPQHFEESQSSGAMDDEASGGVGGLNLVAFRPHVVLSGEV